MFIAHIRKVDKAPQPLSQHLLGVGAMAQQLTKKIGISKAGKIQGVLHDFGKYSEAFLSYISSATGLLNPDLDENWVDAKSLKGRIDHSTAGAQWIWRNLILLKDGRTTTEQNELCAQMLAVCIASHHSGLIDCIDATGASSFNKRIDKSDDVTHLTECLSAADTSVMDEVQALCKSELVDEMWRVIEPILNNPDDQSKVKEFQLGMLTRFLFSTLIDADRIDSADFENPRNIPLRTQEAPNWSVPLERLENHLEKVATRSASSSLEIDAFRRDISQRCKERATQAQGIYSLSVPTGGGKTLASLRYALHHAQTHQLDRIIFIIPYTSIIEQNAEVVRSIVESDSDARPWVLEHHSNLEPDQQTWQSKLFSENWDCPIVFTTMVQFLEGCFAGGTRSARRFHQLAKAVLVFDEVQTLPINCVYLFCNALNFLVTHAQTTALLCTATQPILNKVPDPKSGQLRLSQNHELVGDWASLNQVFSDLERVQVINQCDTHGWPLDRMSDFVLSQFQQVSSVLVVVNTKAWAQDLYVACQGLGIQSDELFHLSTNQCPAHRKALLDGPYGIKSRLKLGKRVLCISTQLIEAGVDVSFSCVIRFLAGLDSIAQAAGRCNRHGELRDLEGQTIKGKVYVVKPEHEGTQSLPEIEVGKAQTERVFRDIQAGYLPDKVLSPEVMRKYFEYFFYQRKDQMCYPLDDGSERNLLAMLGDNRRGRGGNGGMNEARVSKGRGRLLMQSFAEAGAAFRVIDAPTQAVIVPYENGANLIAELCRLDPAYPQFYDVLREAQRYSVNVFPNVLAKLMDAGALKAIQDTGLFFLLPQHYDLSFGVTITTAHDTPTMGLGGVF